MKLGIVKIGSFCIYRGQQKQRCDWASDPNTSASKLKILVTDPDVIVRTRIAHRYDLPEKFTGADCFKKFIQLFLNDTSANVRFAILCNEHIKIPEESLAAIAGDEDEEYFIRLRANELLPDDLKVEELREKICSFPLFLSKKTALMA